MAGQQEVRVFHSQLFDNGKGGLDTFVPPKVMEALGASDGDTVQFALRADGTLALSKVPPEPAAT